MGPSSTWGHSPTLIVCPCLHHWVKSQTVARCSVSCRVWRIWGAPGHPAAPPSATTPDLKKKKGNDLRWTMKRLNMFCRLSSPVQVCDHNSLPPPKRLGGRAALLFLRKNTLGNTPHTPYTHSSALSGTAVGETPPEKRTHWRFFHDVTLLSAPFVPIQPLHTYL